MNRGKLIVFEGLDGSGKSTHMRLLAAELTAQGEKVHQTKEPSDSAVGMYIRKILTESLNKDMNLQAALFLADRLEHITDPADGMNRYLNDGYTVICDRYYYSSFAYQGTKTDLDWVMDINLSAPPMITPDLCIFLDVPPTECKQRLDNERANLELYEKDIQLLEQVRTNFLTVFDKLGSHENIVMIDANRDKNAVFADVAKAAAVIL